MRQQAIKIQPGAMVPVSFNGNATNMWIDTARRLSFRGKKTFLEMRVKVDTENLPVILTNESKCACLYCGTEPRGDERACQSCGAPLPCWKLRKPMARTHKDVEFAVDDASGNERIFSTYGEAAAFAIAVAASRGKTVNLDVLVYSEAGAHAWGGEDAVEQYLDDPEASVFDRIIIAADSVGRIP
jgi:hypothetical protein